VLFSKLLEENVAFETSTVSVDGTVKDESKNTDEATIKKFGKYNKTIRGHLLNHMTKPLFNLFVTFKYAKIIWEKLEAKYSVYNAEKKKYVIGE